MTYFSKDLHEADEVLRGIQDGTDVEQHYILPAASMAYVRALIAAAQDKINAHQVDIDRVPRTCATRDPEVVRYDLVWRRNNPTLTATARIESLKAETETGKGE